ncbi:Alw26I/Eco31I/Esp3I family type II restriction endonuclease [Lysinibacillus sp. FSL K6-0232]|uniref:Alw26I/Eco31I/Esp3I family type II restriction endonuclease n=1 Tax=unclassified Lysinibacillus TaxID=2636778 RepID=UPI0030F85433
MAREKREWHPNFVEYMDFIVQHPTYSGLPIKQRDDGSWSWIAAATTSIGKQRKAWCEQKAQALGIPIEAGVYAKVMLEIHPTKQKVCQTCGNEMSLYYLYPSANFIKALQKKFNVTYSEIDCIYDIWDDLLQKGFSNHQVAKFLIEKGKLPLSSQTASQDEVINALESLCRYQGKKILSPGAMSNFPDRFDGFHTYNRCCRAIQDKGRSKENLKSYTKDRRAYEYLSDGNIHAANSFMGSKFFAGTTADHIGPISLGFVHDPRYLQPMYGSDNSTKRDRLQFVDIEKIIDIENKTNIYPISQHSSLLWEYIKENYQKHPEIIETTYRNALKQNMANFMYILAKILTQCGAKGASVLEQIFLAPKYTYFNYSYEFNENGEIIKQTPRHFTQRSANEYERYKRIAFEAIHDYATKENRNTKPSLDNADLVSLSLLCQDITNDGPLPIIKDKIFELFQVIQRKIIRTF